MKITFWKGFGYWFVNIQHLDFLQILKYEFKLVVLFHVEPTFICHVLFK